MKTVRKYIEEGICNGYIKSAAMLAREIGVTEATVSRWKSGERTPTDDEAVKLASLLRKEPGEILAECGAARAKTPATRQAWERIAARMAGYGITACAIAMPLSYMDEVSKCDGAVCFYFQKLKQLLLSKTCRFVLC